MMTKIDVFVLQWIQDTLAGPFLDRLMPAVTALGDSGFIWLVLSLALFAGKKYRRMGAVMFCSLALGFLVGNLALKPLFARERPFAADPSILLLIEPPGDFSFPSGHTLSSFAAAGTIFLFRKRWRAPALLLAAAIAFSRLYLQVHYPSDVLVGLALGLAVAWLTKKFFDRFLKTLWSDPHRGTDGAG